MVLQDAAGMLAVAPLQRLDDQRMLVMHRDLWRCARR